LLEANQALVEGLRLVFSLTKRDERIAEVHLVCCPVDWHAIARPLLERSPVSGNSLLELGRPTLTLAERSKRETEVILRFGGYKRAASACQFLQGRALGGDRFF
jgi:hypothetical protein